MQREGDREGRKEWGGGGEEDCTLSVLVGETRISSKGILRR